jgi:hypothetical protein
MDVTITIPPELAPKVEQAASRRGRDVAEYIRDLVERSVNRTLDEILAPVREPFAAQSASTPPALEEALRRLKLYLDDLTTGYPDVAYRTRAWDQFRQTLREQLWAACEPLDGHRRQLADQLEAAVEKIDAAQLQPAHLDATRLSLERLSNDQVGPNDVHECEKAWRRGEVETLPSWNRILSQWEEFYGAGDD